MEVVAVEPLILGQFKERRPAPDVGCEFEVEDVAEAAFKEVKEPVEGAEPYVDVDFVSENVVVVLESAVEVEEALNVAREV